KHNYYDTRTFSSAAYGMVSVNGFFIAIGNSFSYEMDGIGFHGGIGSVTLLHNSKTYGLFLLGSKAKIFDFLYGIAEYSNTPSEMLDMNKKFTGMVTAGLRYRDKYCGLEAALSKPFGNNSIDLFPVIKCIAYF
ncbi:MAG TPA: hypothetical protein VHO28_04025, partial [Ignavibacteriales bacterium]|nr:hypothetical protein [Ignavibacteriales bacterium]